MQFQLHAEIHAVIFHRLPVALNNRLGDGLRSDKSGSVINRIRLTSVHLRTNVGPGKGNGIASCY